MDPFNRLPAKSHTYYYYFRLARKPEITTQQMPINRRLKDRMRFGAGIKLPQGQGSFTRSCVDSGFRNQPG